MLQKKLAEQFNVQVTCPFATKKALQAIAHDSNQQVAYWRVINKNGPLITYFPGRLEGHAALLLQEGFMIETAGNVPKVKYFREHMDRFEESRE